MIKKSVSALDTVIKPLVAWLRKESTQKLLFYAALYGFVIFLGQLFLREEKPMDWLVAREATWSLWLIWGLSLPCALFGVARIVRYFVKRRKVALPHFAAFALIVAVALQFSLVSAWTNSERVVPKQLNDVVGYFTPSTGRGWESAIYSGKTESGKCFYLTEKKFLACAPKERLTFVTRIEDENDPDFPNGTFRPSVGERVYVDRVMMCGPYYEGDCYANFFVWPGNTKYRFDDDPSI